MSSVPSKNKKDGKRLLSDETVEALERLGDVLRPIYMRAKREGYILIDGKFVKPDKHEKGKH